MKIEDEILHCIELIGIETSEYKENNISDIFTKINFSSIEFISLIVMLEEELNIEFPPEILDIKMISSFDYFVQIVKELVLDAELKNEGV